MSFLRVDATIALDDASVKQSLHNYVKIVKGQQLANYLILKKIKIGEKLSNDLKKLWKLHEYWMGKYRKSGSKLGENGAHGPSLLDLKAKIANLMLSKCEFCERVCRVNRRETLGFCGVFKDSRVHSAFLHYGEEPELVPSGTIFFSGCNFKCQFCQNWDISQEPFSGSVWGPTEIVRWIRKVKKSGGRNINFVGGDPTPNLHTILNALLECDTNIAMVWNSNMYLTKKAMSLLDGVIDVYLTDFKYGNSQCAAELSKVPKYFEVVSRNHKLASRSAELIIRHLVLPGHTICCSEPILEWISENLDKNVRINIMDQYRPEGNVLANPEKYGAINRRLRPQEFEHVVAFASRLGLKNIIM